MNVLKIIITILTFFLSILTISAQNTTFGNGAGQMIYPSSSENVLLGENSGLLLYGDMNTSVGSCSMGEFRGNENVFLGFKAGDQYSSPLQDFNWNVGIGSYAGNRFQGEANTYIGSYSGDTSYGSNNTLVGAFNLEVSGDYNIILGTVNYGLNIDNQLFIGHDGTPLIWGDFNTRALTLGDHLNVSSTGELTFRAFKVDASGNVGIGTTNPQAALAVNGTILAEEIKVSLASNWPDYVFEEDYDLKELSEVEAYIKAHKHLPEMPSAKEIQEEGIDLAKMNKLLLKKVEELMLYTIQLEKEVKRQEASIEKVDILSSKIHFMEETIKKLSK